MAYWILREASLPVPALSNSWINPNIPKRSRCSVFLLSINRLQIGTVTYLVEYYTDRYRTTLNKIVPRISSTFVENNDRSLGNDGAWVMIRRENGQIVSCREGQSVPSALQQA